MASDKIFKPLQKKIEYLDKIQIKEIHQAYLLAADAHQTQKRSTGEPYITHPVAVAIILADLRLDKETIMAALLHDVIEDTHIDKPTLRQKFGKQVAELVDGVSKLTQIEAISRPELDARNLQKTLMATTRDVRVILLKLADRLHNTRTIQALPQAKRARIAQHTLESLAPIARRLGMRYIASELEELCFAALYPDRYRVLKATCERIQSGRKPILKEINQALVKVLKNLNLPCYTLESRQKHLYSIYRKMRDKHMSFSAMMDVYAVRIITEAQQDCYRILGVIHQLYKPLPGSFKDYIAMPKKNGYQSLHTVLFGPYGVPIEVQIRTACMHEIATIGVAAHASYKVGKMPTISGQPQVKINEWIKKLKEIQTQTNCPITFTKNVKMELLLQTIYVFTPTHELFELPIDSTPIDFAYAISPDLGHHCLSAMIDGRTVPLITKLTSGQTVNIITSPYAHPCPTWLHCVTTGRARTRIERFLNHQEHETAMKIGKLLLKQAINDINIKRYQIKKNTIQLLLTSLKLDSLPALYQAIGQGHQPALLMAKRIADIIACPADQVPTLMQRKETAPLIIKGTEGMMVHYATCCHPIPGDMIISELTIEQGLVIHTDHCQKIIKHAKTKNKYSKVRWAEEVTKEFTVPIEAMLLNTRGALAMLSASLAYCQSNIQSIEITQTLDKYITVSLLVCVKDTHQLKEALRHARKSSTLIDIKRVQ